jgi:protease I
MNRLFSLILSFILALGVISCSKQVEQEVQLPDLTGKRVVMIIAHDGFRDEELMEPKAVLEGQGAEVVVASSSLGEARGMKGATVKPDILLDELDASQFDAVIFVGGVGASEYWDNPKAHEIARKALDSGRIVAAICIAPVTLANAGLLQGKKATVYPSEKGKLEAKGAVCTGANVEVDGRIITANGPSAARKFGEAIARKLGE